MTFVPVQCVRASLSRNYHCHFPRSRPAGFNDLSTSDTRHETNRLSPGKHCAGIVPYRFSFTIQPRFRVWPHPLFTPSLLFINFSSTPNIVHALRYSDRTCSKVRALLAYLLFLVPCTTKYYYYYVLILDNPIVPNRKFLFIPRKIRTEVTDAPGVEIGAFQKEGKGEGERERER